MHMETLECKYASVQLLLNRKSSSRMIESQSPLSLFNTNTHTHTKYTLHTLAHAHAEALGLEAWFQYCKVSQVQRDTLSEGLLKAVFWLQLQATACCFACLICRCMTTGGWSFRLAHMFSMYLPCDTIWRKKTVSEDKLRMGRDWLVDWRSKGKSIHFTPLWHTCMHWHEVGSAHTHTSTQCQSQLSRTSSLIPATPAREMLATLIKASLSTWHAYMQKAQKASFVP